MYLKNSHAAGTCRCRRCRRPRQAAPCARPRGAWKKLLDQAELAVAPDERRLQPAERSAPPRPADDAERAPQRTGSALPFSSCSPASSYATAASVAPCRLADEDRAGLGRPLDSRGRVDDVAGDHALTLGAERDRRLAGEDAGGSRRRSRRAREPAATRSSAAHRPLGVVLLRDRRAPDRHDRVADELLDRAAVALDHRPRQVEVAGKELARLLGIAVLGACR